MGTEEQGIVVFDESEKSKSHILIDQTHRYFRETKVGQQRSRLILPEPFFVHSDLTTGVQIADLVAYCVSWGFRIKGLMTKPARAELDSYAKQIATLRYMAERHINGTHRQIWSIAYINDLRTNLERLEEDGAEA